MGGFGSGRFGWHDAKDLVEDCRRLSADELTRLGALRSGSVGSGTVTWRDADTDEVTSKVGYEADTRPGVSPTLRLRYTPTGTGEPADYRVILEATATPWGKVRWFFRCPLVRGDAVCRRRVGCLYLPPGGRYFGCRRCYDLAYTSSRESRKHDAFYRRMAADLGLDVDAVREMW